jgi:hypothetical protein
MRFCVDLVAGSFGFFDRSRARSVRLKAVDQSDENSLLNSKASSACCVSKRARFAISTYPLLHSSDRFAAMTIPTSR